VALHKVLVVNRLQKVIDEHTKAQETVKDSRKFLSEVQKYVNNVRLVDSEIPFILHQFEAFHDKVTGFQKKIENLKK
jgi:hypothetical protein